MLKMAAVTVLSIPLVLAGVVASTGLVVVDVKSADGPRIVLPVPLVVARTALSFAPEEARLVEVPELSEYSELCSRLLSELRNAPDGVLVEVHDGNDHVRIEKFGDELSVEVESDDDDVSVHVPFEVASRVLESYDGNRLETSEVLAALSSASRTDLVHVKSGEEEVKIWIW